MKLLRKKVSGNVYQSEEVSGRYDYKYADTVEAGYEEAHTVGDVTTEQGAIDKWGSVATDDTLSGHKVAKNKEIDKRTGEIISMGFVYATKVYSLSNNAQLNLLGIDIKRNDGILPITFNTIDDLDEVTLTTATEIDGFFMTALGTKKAHLDSGTSLKLQVRNAIDKAGVDAVIDNR